MNTTMLSKILLDSISLILLTFLIYLIARNTALTKSSTKNFICVIALTITVIVAEIVSVLLDIPNSSLQVLNIIINVIGFSIAPFIAVRLAFLYDHDLERKSRYIEIPLFINVGICLLSTYTGWIFDIGADNQYQRGPYFFVFVLISLYAFVVLIYSNYKNASKYQIGEKIYLYGLYSLVLFANIIQIMFPQILIIWGAVSTTLVLYYIFLRELQFKYDPLTNLLNRQAFECEMEEFAELDEATVFVFDLNNLKYMNDTYGHSVGDTYLVQASKIIKESFEHIGNCYRIGGDEFCVLSKITEKNKITMSEEKMTNQIKKYELIWNEHFNIAYGHSVYHRKCMKSIYTAFTEADKKMYMNKEIIKKNNGFI